MKSMKTDSGFGFSLAILWSMFKVAAVTMIVSLAVYLAVYFSPLDHTPIGLKAAITGLVFGAMGSAYWRARYFPAIMEQAKKAREASLARPDPMTNQLPDGLVAGGTSPVFSQDTLPDALQAEHSLAPGHWAVLNVLEGTLRFVNLETGEERLLSAPDRATIHPGLSHRVALEGRLRCRLDFFRKPPD